MPKEDVAKEEVIKLAIMAVGGQGGGVLTNWIIDLAQRNGYRAQATSVAGVAQRTGATIYYIEMLSRNERQPVLSLMPTPGDVDVVIAAELMEAGRAMLRGFVTADNTTLIASSHRTLAVSEKVHPGDGIAYSDKVAEAAHKRAHRYIAFDMNDIAVQCGTVISASLFGALAGSGVLPFPASAFEETIRSSGRGVEPSLAAFDQARRRASTEDTASPTRESSEVDNAKIPGEVSGPSRLRRQWQELAETVSALPEPVQEMAYRGLGKVVDFQDAEYGQQYLDYLNRALEADRQNGGDRHDFALTCAAAKYVANAMVYDDVIRVADLKTRGSRFRRVNEEIGVDNTQVLQITEFMHPRAEELCGMLPARLGRYIESRPTLFRSIDWLVNRGRRVRTDSMFWFLVLYSVAGLRRFRRGMLRHSVERTHLEEWLDSVIACAGQNYDLAVELINNRRLIKGYSDTHKRGISKFDRVKSAAPFIMSRDDAAQQMKQLRESALADETGTGLDQKLAELAN